MLKKHTMYYVYVIKSQVDARLYKGLTKNVKERVLQHNTGKTKTTKGYIPWELVYFEKYQTIEEARKREKYLKSGVGREFLKSLLLSTK